MSINKARKQQGFSLVEIMIGLVIGLLATLVIMNVFSVFEQQKRTTTGNSDAQTNGAIALFNVQRDVQTAGYGMPVYGSDYSPFNCPVDPALDLNANTSTPTVDHDKNAATARIGLSPLVITDGGANGSDIISIRTGDSMKGGAALDMEGGTAANVAQVDTNIGCAKNDIALIIDHSAALKCSLTQVKFDPTPFGAAFKITVDAAAATLVATGNSLACLGVWNEVQYTVANNQLTRSGAIDIDAVTGERVPNATAVPIVPDIVNMQAQYGISVTPDSNQVTQWVDATGLFANPSLNDRNRIKAIRIAIVARNGLLERENVTAACSSLNAANPTGLCAWAGTAGSDAPAINLAADANWQRYRYRVYESIIPIKNIIWSRSVI